MGLYIGNTRYCPVIGKGLPYDAEISYLITDGSAYIDTGIDGKQLLIVSITMARAEDTGSVSRVLFGFWNDASSYTGLIQLMTESNKIVAPSGRNSFTLAGISSSTTLVQDTFYSFTITQTQVTTTDRTAYVFCRNNGAPSMINTHVKIKRVSMTRNNTLVRDFIPVRVGQVGYMYDRVSGQLFENANSTGAFILGPDIT